MNTLAQNWWALTIRGSLAIAFGLLAWAWPGMTLILLIVLFGAYALADGLFAIVSAVRQARRHERWWPVAIEGVLGIAAGIVTFFVPAAAAITFLVVIAAWALTTGVLEIVAAIRLRKQIKGEWLLAMSGILSVAFGVLLIMRPGPGLLAIVWLMAAYAVAYGVVLIALSLRLRRARSISAQPTTLGGATPQPA
jgi:uncharacterized membrane protein HdeD (DUF308 family)